MVTQIVFKLTAKEKRKFMAACDKRGVEMSERLRYLTMADIEGSIADDLCEGYDPTWRGHCGPKPKRKPRSK